MNLILRQASASRPSGSWSEHDYDVVHGERVVGRVYRITDHADSPWFWGVAFELTGYRSYGTADTLDAAKAAFRSKYERELKRLDNQDPQEEAAKKSPASR